MGGDGTCPPVPPHCYWSFKFQSERGEEAIGDWFQGYQHGGASALSSGRNQYHPVPISGVFRQYSPSCLPSDFAPYELGRSSLGLTNPPLSSAEHHVEDEALPDSTPLEAETRSSDGGGPPADGLSTLKSVPVNPLPGVPTTEAVNRATE
ncbi:hypothetical protein [Schlesneria paludicola]|uniref:hypothetical protein n=1 Tax=Schlesneria paludicola TaxID=360056 RepID=UPI00029A9AA4|nr:hypothetical protein [Schlesneria paludicola]